MNKKPLLNFSRKAAFLTYIFTNEIKTLIKTSERSYRIFRSKHRGSFKMKTGLWDTLDMKTL